MITRRSLLAASAASLSCALAADREKRLPVGLELYSVRNELKQDLMGTVRAVAAMGYQDVEFYAPYTDWTPDYAKQVRKLLDDTGMRCMSTHNGAKTFNGGDLAHAIELNQILGTRFMVLASAGRIQTLDGWKGVADTLNKAADQMRPSKLRAGYHNHALEFKPLDGKRPIEVLAANTSKDIMLQLDVGTCVEMGSDPVAWINANPGRINSLHLKDWAPGEGKGYEVLFGEGVVPWQPVLDAAIKTGGAQFFLIEQEGSRFPALETAERCLKTYRQMVA